MTLNKNMPSAMTPCAPGAQGNHHPRHPQEFQPKIVLYRTEMCTRPFLRSNRQEEGTLDSIGWGWNLDGNCYTPVKMKQAPGLPNIMKIIFCACNLCRCRKHGLICNMACKNCAGSNCTIIEKFSAEQLLAVELEALAEENSTEDTDD